MRKFFVWSWFLALLSGGCHEEPRAILDELKTVDLGCVPPGQPIGFEVVLGNKGTAPLKINQISASCRCIMMSASELEVFPRQSGRVKGVIDVPTAQRPFHYEVMFKTNDVRNPIARVDIIGNAVHLFTLIPERVVYFPLPDSNPRVSSMEQVVHLKLLDESADLIELKVESPMDFITARVASTSKRNGTFSVKVSDECPSGEIDVSLRVVAKLATGEMLNRNYIVGGLIRSDYVASPGLIIIPIQPVGRLQNIMVAPPLPDNTQCQIIGDLSTGLHAKVEDGGRQIVLGYEPIPVSNPSYSGTLIATNSGKCLLSVPIFRPK